MGDVAAPSKQLSSDERRLLFESLLDPKLSDDPAKFRALIKLYVAQGLRGTEDVYDHFVERLQALKAEAEAAGPAAEAGAGGAQVVPLFRALGACISMVKDDKQPRVLAEVLGVRLWHVRQEVSSSVLELWLDIMTGRPDLLHACLQVLVFSLLPPPTAPCPEAPAPDGAWRPAALALQVQDRVLHVLSQVMLRLPSIPRCVQPLLLQAMPHKLRDRNAQCLYLRGLFWLAEQPQGVALQEGVLAAAVEALLGVDVEIKWEDIADSGMGLQEEEQEEEEEEEDGDIFELDGLTLADGGELPGEGWEGGGQRSAASMAAQRQAAAAAGQPPQVDEVAEKLDAMMDLTFSHLQHRVEQEGVAPVWSCLLLVFERFVLHTHRSKFTQYLLFYVAARQPELCARSLTDLLLHRIGDAGSAPITRAACAAYLASFLARAAYVPRHLLLECLEQLAQLAVEHAARELKRRGSRRQQLAEEDELRALCHLDHAYPMSEPLLQQQAHAGAAQQQQQQHSSRHQVFYAMCQALLYVLCYHLPPLAAPRCPQRPGLKKLLAGNVAALVTHPLAPLDACLPSVVSVCGQRLQSLGLAHTARWPKEALQSEQPPRSHRPLEMFFPFDPYLLRHSARHLDLHHTYYQWRHGRPIGGGAGGGGQDGGGDSNADTTEHEDTAEASREDHAEDDDDSDTATSPSCSSGDEDEDLMEDHDTIAASLEGPPSQPPAGRFSSLSSRLRPTSIARLNSHHHLPSPSPGDDPMHPYGTSPMSMGGSPHAGPLAASISSGGGFSPIVGTSPVVGLPMSMTPDLHHLPQVMAARVPAPAAGRSWLPS